MIYMTKVGWVRSLFLAIALCCTATSAQTDTTSAPLPPIITAAGGHALGFLVGPAVAGVVYSGVKSFYPIDEIDQTELRGLGQALYFLPSVAVGAAIGTVIGMSEHVTDIDDRRMLFKLSLLPYAVVPIIATLPGVGYAAVIFTPIVSIALPVMYYYNTIKPRHQNEVAGSRFARLPEMAFGAMAGLYGGPIGMGAGFFGLNHWVKNHSMSLDSSLVSEESGTTKEIKHMLRKKKLIAFTLGALVGTVGHYYNIKSISSR